jgi:NAD-dependent epimerase/dehydratase family protein
MAHALLGYTGFVGGNLDRDARFDARYRSSDIDEIRGRSFDLVVSAALPAAKWLANRDPNADWATVSRLIEALEHVEAEEFVLVSTVDVYGRPHGVYEDDRPSPDGATPYGAHRFRFEEFVRNRFARAVVIRLPGLFGPGLRKNVLFDLLHERQLEAIDPGSVFQWYDVRDLWADIGRIRACGLSLVNLATAPIATECILAEHFPELEVGGSRGPSVRYDVQTRHAEPLGGDPPYVRSEPEVLSRIARFVNEVRQGKVACASQSRT